jgi:predicted metal-dependent peptidase
LKLLYNPDFFEELSDKHRAGVLKHEFYHLVFDHVTGRKPDGVNHRLWNIATDLAINSHLVNELPDNCLFPGRAGTPFEKYPVGKSAEWYLEALKKDQSEEGQGSDGKDKSDSGDDSGSGSGSGKPDDEDGDGSGSGGGDWQFDEHEGWDKVDAATKEMARERIKDVLRKAAEEATKSNSWGSVSSSVRKEILDRIRSVIDWRKVLRYFVKTSQRANKTSTVKKINRRYPYIHPGKRVRRQAKIAISIDQSGSVDDGMLAAFFSELNGLAKFAEFTVIPFDSEVAEDKVYVWKRGENRKWERVRYGGTDFNPPTDYVNARRFDGHIILTDLCAPKPKASKCQRMWMTTEYYANSPYFQTNERIVAIKPKVA